ncbi:MAG: ABC transporter ATP-binding protein [candidate division Zixibacteria bacterium]|nr:ABC transporter ATP-binding protein [candidate division Zixibacteria bacterium]
MSSDPLIRTINLCRYYRRGQSEVRAVDTVSLAVNRNEFVSVVGSSGSGKSTLLNLLAGLDTPSGGEIEIDGTPLGSRSRRELSTYRARRVGIVFQSFNLIAHYTALQNVEAALLFNHTPPRERHRLASAILDRLGLADRMTHRPADLSGGEQQRVALARAIVKHPEILFADEPTGNLDEDNSRQIVELLADLNRSGLTVVMVTHNLDLARTYAQRIIRMHYGRVVDDALVGGPAQ